jgi:hypothetical protein
MALGAPLRVLPRGASLPWLALNVRPTPAFLSIPGRRMLGLAIFAFHLLLSFFDVFEFGSWYFRDQSII